MVMMGQQLMDPERKQEDEDYVIQTTTQDHLLQNPQKDKMIKQQQRNVPTLAFLAERTRQKHLNTDGKPNEEGDDQIPDQDQVKLVEATIRVPNGEGDGPGIAILKQSQNIDEGIKTASNSNSTTATTQQVVETTENSSSGRTSSCEGDSSGIGSSLTSSSSSEPIERETSPAAVVVEGANNGSLQDVPEKTVVVPVPVVTVEVGVGGNGTPNDTDPDPCKALLLCEDFNGQMTAAKRFLQMVRNGIKEGDDGTGNRSSKFEPSSDDDSKPVAILNNNNNIVKDSSSGGGSGRSSKAASNVSSTAASNVPLVNHILENGPPPDCVQEVWAHNLLEEFAKIRQVVKKYNFIAMDTEFPGIVVRPQCTVRSNGVFPYQLLKMNVDRLRIIQLGVTFMDKNGKTPEGVCTWQFNFKFSLNKDLYASDSISLLTRCGIQFEKHAQLGIEPLAFGEYFMSSGMVTSDLVTYLTFHSGFDFGYLIKLLSNSPLPENEERFFDYMKIYFPNVYDLKFLMKSVDLHGGLQDIANQMGQQRVGTQHQAGSDSLLTGMTFFKILEDIFKGEIDEAKYSGKLYGFHMTPEDGRDEGWTDIPGGEILDTTSPKPPPPMSRTSNMIGGPSALPLPMSLAPQLLQQHSLAPNPNSNGDIGR